MFNKLIISDKPVATPTNVFELRVTYMHGDADHYTKDKYYYYKDEEEKLLAHLNFLVACINAFPHGMRGNDGYWAVPGYTGFGDEWVPLDNECCEGHATVWEIDTYFINEEGKLFLVTPAEV